MRNFLAEGHTPAIDHCFVKHRSLVGNLSLAAVAFFASPTLCISETADDPSPAEAVAISSPPRIAVVDTKATQLLARVAAPKLRLANISARLAVGIGDNVLIGGFIITGSQPKKIVVRALGPLLPVSENLADPVLALHSSSGLVATNDNWRDTQQSELKASIPPTNDYDSAIVRTVKPGAYTAVLAGKGGTTGVGLLEIYDLELNPDSSLANISTRGFVGTADNILIGGTIIVGSGSTTVLFRALGPSTGVPNSLKDPTLTVHNGQGTAIATNDNWQDSQQAAAIQATTIPPPDPREAAILRQLTPGAYTAVVRGKKDTTGVALIEAYQLE